MIPGLSVPIRLWRMLLIAAGLCAVIMACLPHPPKLPGEPPDTLLHFLAFLVLTVLARAAYPHARAWQILVWLAALGGAIELVQAIPWLGRDADMRDLFTDILAIVAGLGMTMLLSRKARRETV